jgi:oligosaccharide repeat unit polymerase
VPVHAVLESRQQQAIRVAAGVLSVCFFGGLAIYLVPGNPQPAGELVASGMVMAFGLLLVPVVYAYKGQERAFRAEHILCFGLVYWLLLDVIQGAYDVDLSFEVTQQVFLAITFMAVGIWIGSAFGPKRLPQPIFRMLERPLRSDHLFQAGMLCFVLGMLTFLIATDFDIFEAASYIGAPRWSAPWGRGDLGGLDAFQDHLQYFGYVVPAIAVAYGVRRGWFRFASLILLACAVVIVLFLSQSGGRRIVGVTVGAAMLCWTLMQAKLRLSTIVVLLGGATVLLAALQLMLQYRVEGWFVESESSYRHLHVDDNFLRLGQVMELVPAEHPYIYLNQLFFIAIRPVPRLFWEGKPTDPGFNLPELIGNTGASLSTSMLGEWYLVWGMPTILLGGIAMGVLCALVNLVVVRCQHGDNAVVAAVSLMVIFASVRSLQDLVLMSYAIMALLGAMALMRRRAPVSARRPSG